MHLTHLLPLLLLPLTPTAASLPTIDLGYLKQRATSFNSTGRYYNFSNIRYAAPPTGDLRWRIPAAPARDTSGKIHDGSAGVICPGVDPSWENVAEKWIPAYLTGTQPHVTMEELAKVNGSVGLKNVPKMDPRTSEDCLFLDVMAPEKVFEGRGKGKGAPVLVWIYGGGYTTGDKTDSGNPAGLLERSTYDGREGMLFVAMNYRLGAFGFLAGPSLQADGVANAAFYDQRFALEWVQKYIHLFGGDASRVTVMGESAGGGSIMHQLTAYAGLVPVPFQQAILQSPGWQPYVSNWVNEANYVNLLGYTGAANLSALRALSSDDLIAANYVQVWRSQYGGFTYGPTVDGFFVPALPGQSLNAGRFARDVKVMVGHNSNEGLLFSDPLIKNNTDFVYFLAQVFPTANPEVLAFVADTLYPPVFDGSYGYTDAITRTATALAEAVFVCNTVYLDRAYGGTTYEYEFSVPPGIHGEDVAYTFYNGGGTNFGDLLLNTTVAVALQDYIVTFATTGTPSAPNVKGLPRFVMYGKDSGIIDLGLSTITEEMDSTNKFRCEWWQSVLYQ